VRGWVAARELSAPGWYRDLVTAGASRPFATKSPIGLRSTKIAFACRGTPLPAQCVMPVLPIVTDDSRALPVHDRARDQLCPVGLGVLTGEISPGLVDEVIDLTGCREKRRSCCRRGRWCISCWAVPVFSGADSMGPAGYRS